MQRRRLTYPTRELSNGQIGWRYDLAIREQRLHGTGTPMSDLWPELARITAPTLIVRGADTDILSPEVAQRMVETIPNSQLVEVQRAGHIVFEDNPDGFLAAVSGFLA